MLTGSYHVCLPAAIHRLPHRIIVNPDTAPVVKEIFEMASLGKKAQGKSPRR